MYPKDVFVTVRDNEAAEVRPRVIHHTPLLTCVVGVFCKSCEALVRHMIVSQYPFLPIMQDVVTRLRHEAAMAERRFFVSAFIFLFLFLFLLLFLFYFHLYFCSCFYFLFCSVLSSCATNAWCQFHSVACHSTIYLYIFPPSTFPPSTFGRIKTPVPKLHRPTVLDPKFNVCHEKPNRRYLRVCMCVCVCACVCGVRACVCVCVCTLYGF